MISTQFFLVLFVGIVTGYNLALFFHHVKVQAVLDLRRRCLESIERMDEVIHKIQNGMPVGPWDRPRAKDIDIKP